MAKECTDISLKPENSKIDKVDLKKRKTIKNIGKLAYSAPLTMTLLTSKKALAQSPPLLCDDRITIVSVTADPSMVPCIIPSPEEVEVTLACVAESYNNSKLTYTWSTGQTGSVITVDPRSLPMAPLPPAQESGCTEPIEVTVSDGECSKTGSTVICFDDACKPACPERIAILSVTAEPRIIPCPPESDVVTLTCVAGSYNNSQLTYTWSTGQTGSVITVDPRSLLMAPLPPAQESGCTEPIEVTVSDGECSKTGSIVICFDDACEPACSERITIVSLTAEPSTIPCPPESDLILTCVAESDNKLPLTYTWNTGQTGSVITVDKNFLPWATEPYCRRFEVTISDGECLISDNIIVCFERLCEFPD